MSYYRNVVIRIEYIAGSGSGIKGESAGDFRLKGRKPEQVAYEWFQQLDKEMYNLRLDKVTLDGDIDITDKVKALFVIPEDNLPF